MNFPGKRVQRLKVCVASSGLGHVSRGIEAWAADLGRALHDRGEAVLLFKGAGNADLPFERIVPCLRRADAKTERLLRTLPRRLFWRVGLSSGYGVEQASFAAQMLRQLRQERIDILHVQDPMLALWMHRAARLGLVSTRTILGHGTEESLDFLDKLQFVQHLAPWHLEEARQAGASKPTWTAIPNFIDTDHFSPARSAMRQELGIPEDAVIVLTAAAIKRQHKRIDYLIEEFARLRSASPQTPAWLVIAGGWEQETDELVRYGTERLGDRVRFLVRFPRERMPELYRMADVFTLCSLKEMMPIALLEAMASGLPCVVNRHPVLEWMIGAGGRAIDMAAPGALSLALAGLLADVEARRGLGRQARDHCVATFSRDRVVDQIVDYYQFVMAHKWPVARQRGTA